MKSPTEMINPKEIINKLEHLKQLHPTHDRENFIRQKLMDDIETTRIIKNTSYTTSSSPILSISQMN